MHVFINALSTMLILLFACSGVHAQVAKIEARSAVQIVDDAEELMNAIKSLDVKAVQKLLENGTDVNAKGQYTFPVNFTAGLYVPDESIEQQNIIFDLLVKHGADVEKVAGHLGYQPIHSAAATGNCHIVARLLQKGISIEALDNSDRTPLFSAIGGKIRQKPEQERRIEHCITFLIERGANIKARNKHGAGVLTAAAVSGRDALLRHLLDKGAHVNEVDNDGRTPLIAATRAMQVKSVEILLANGADVNAQDNEGDTSLLLATGLDMRPMARSEGKKEAHEKVARLLISNGADVNLKNKHGMSPLWTAVFRGYTEAVQLLLENKADPNTTSKQGRSALFVSVHNAGITKLLLDHGADAYAAGSRGELETLMLEALSARNVDTMRLLIDRRLDTHKDGTKDNRYAFRAAGGSSPEVLAVFLDTGTDSNLTDEEGKSLLMAAAGSGDDTARNIWLLLDRGAKIDAKDSRGATALMAAAQASNFNGVRALLERGASPKASDASGNTVLDYANEAFVRFGQLEQRGPAMKRKAENVQKILDLLNGNHEVQQAARTAEGTYVYIPHAKIKIATEGLPAQRAELARHYYYGLEDVPQSFTEAYYWFSICSYELSEVDENPAKNFQKRVLMLEDASYARAAKFGAEDKRALYHLMNDAPVKEMCSVFLKTLNKKLTAAEQQAVRPRIDDWVKRHPIEKQDVTLQASDGKRARLMRAINDSVYDLGGIASIIAGGVNVSADSVFVEAAQKMGRRDIVQLLREIAGGADPVVASTKISPLPAAGNKQPVLLVEEVVDHPSNALTARAVQALLQGSPAARSQAIAEVTASPQKYNPPALNALSRALFSKFKDEEAVFWYYAGKFRKEQADAYCPRKGQPSYPAHDEPGLLEYFKIMQPDMHLDMLHKAMKWNNDTAVEYNLQYGPKKSECLVGAALEAVKKESIHKQFLLDEQKLKKAGHYFSEKLDADELVEKANAGNAEAQFKLYACYTGLHCKRPNEEMQQSFDARAAEEKQQALQNIKVFKGRDERAMRKQKAIFWLKKAVDQKYPAAYAALATEYMQDGGILPRDDQKACAVMLHMVQEGNPLVYGLAARAPWNPHRSESQIESKAWNDVRLAATGQSEDEDIEWANTSMSAQDIAEAKHRAEKYAELYIKQKKPICSYQNE